VDFVICNAHAGNAGLWYVGVADVLGFTHIYALNSLTGALVANHHLPPLDFIRTLIVSAEGCVHVALVVLLSYVIARAHCSHHLYGLIEDVTAGTARVGSWHLDEILHTFEYRFNTGVPGLQVRRR
jgi:hypothetical protein